MREEESAVIIDNGSGIIKAGFGGEEDPNVTFPTLVGRRADSQETFIGRDAIVNDAIHKKYPITRGTITNWDDMEAVWRHIFNDELNVKSKDRPVLLTEAPMVAKQQRERTAQIMFETFNVPALYVTIPAILSMYASGRTKGIVLDSGYGVTHVAPFHDGNMITKGLTKVDMAGSDLTHHLRTILTEKGYSFRGVTDRELQVAKEKLSYAAKNHDEESSMEETFTLPDGQAITLASERFKCIEPMFRPSLIGLESKGIHGIVHESITKCDMDVRKDLYGSIVLSGGNCTVPNLAERLEKEIASLAIANTKVKVITPMHVKHLAWTGGSLLASMPVFEKMWIRRGEYEEVGTSIVHKNRG